MDLDRTNDDEVFELAKSSTDERVDGGDLHACDPIVRRIAARVTA